MNEFFSQKEFTFYFIFSSSQLLCLFYIQCRIQATCKIEEEKIYSNGFEEEEKIARCTTGAKGQYT